MKLDFNSSVSIYRKVGFWENDLLQNFGLLLILEWDNIKLIYLCFIQKSFKQNLKTEY